MLPVAQRRAGLGGSFNEQLFRIISAAVGVKQVLKRDIQGGRDAGPHAADGFGQEVSPLVGGGYYAEIHFVNKSR